MPFTIAHAAAAPLVRAMGRGRLWMPAIIAGCLAPDALYYVPITPPVASHSVAGLALIALPAGLLMVALWCALLRDVAPTLLPPPYDARAWWAWRETTRPKPSPVAVVASVLAGACSHILWDAFTHRRGFVVAIAPGLRETLGGWPLYSWLQHGGTVVGLALLALWAWRWVRDLPFAPRVVMPLAPHREPIWIVGGATISAGAFIGLSQGSSFGPRLVRAAIMSVDFAAVVLLGLAVWHRFAGGASRAR